MQSYFNSRICCLKHVYVCVHAQACPTLCDLMDCSPPGSSVNGILQARILEWVATSSFRGSSWPRDWTCISWISLHRQVNSLPLSYRGAQLVKNLPTMQEPQVQFLGQEDSLEKDRLPLLYSWASLVAQMIRNLPPVREISVRSLGWEDS